MATEQTNKIDLFDEDVLALTAAGENELKGSSTGLTPTELELLVLLDGSSTVAEVSRRVKTLPAAAVAAALGGLFVKNLVMISSKAQAEEADKLRALGAIEVIAKPFDPITLAPSVRSAWLRWRG